jgi:hypothetical protein
MQGNKEDLTKPDNRSEVSTMHELCVMVWSMSAFERIRHGY